MYISKMIPLCSAICCLKVHIDLVACKQDENMQKTRSNVTAGETNRTRACQRLPKYFSEHGATLSGDIKQIIRTRTARKILVVFKLKGGKC